MVLLVKFEALYYVSGDYGLKQGVKKGKTPPQAIGGGNGSFIIKKSSPQLILVLSGGGRRYERDIYQLVKSVNQKKLTSAYRCSLAELFQNLTFQVKNGELENFDVEIKLLISFHEKQQLTSNSKK